mmetsp:Transcript_11624/g.21039  ORF Transcript_11624/g.21039 Transcript_11624/m.21039 type:complete len:208 (-) Transcript_11624:935-1558(-)
MRGRSSPACGLWWSKRWRSSKPRPPRPRAQPRRMRPLRYRPRRQRPTTAPTAPTALLPAAASRSPLQWLCRSHQASPGCPMSSRRRWLARPASPRPAGLLERQSPAAGPHSLRRLPALNRSLPRPGPALAPSRPAPPKTRTCLPWSRRHHSGLSPHASGTARTYCPYGGSGCVRHRPRRRPACRHRRCGQGARARAPAPEYPIRTKE